LVGVQDEVFLGGIAGMNCQGCRWSGSKQAEKRKKEKKGEKKEGKRRNWFDSFAAATGSAIRGMHTHIDSVDIQSPTFYPLAARAFQGDKLARLEIPPVLNRKGCVGRARMRQGGSRIAAEVAVAEEKRREGINRGRLWDLYVS
jgi:hypothetical protein